MWNYIEFLKYQIGLKYLFDIQLKYLFDIVSNLKSLK